MDTNEGLPWSPDDITGDDLKLMDEMCRCYRQGLDTFRRMLSVVRQRLHREPNPDQTVRDREWTWLLSYENLLDCIERNVDPINYQFEPVELSSEEEMADAWQQFEQQWEMSGPQRTEVTSSTVCTITLHSAPLVSQENTPADSPLDDWSQHNFQVQVLDEPTLDQPNSEWLQEQQCCEEMPQPATLSSSLPDSWNGDQLQIALESLTQPNWLANQNHACYGEMVQCSLPMDCGDYGQMQYEYSAELSNQSPEVPLVENGQYSTDCGPYVETNYAFVSSSQTNYAMQSIYDETVGMNGVDTAQVYPGMPDNPMSAVPMAAPEQLPFDDNYDLDKLFENNLTEVCNQEIDSAINLDFGTTSDDVDSSLLQLLNGVNESSFDNTISLNLQFDQLLEQHKIN